MPNKRQLKKYVRHLCGSVAGECILARAIDDADPQLIGQAIVEVADLQDATLQLVSFSFDKGQREFDDAKAYRRARRAYYRKAYAKLTKEFHEGLNNAVSTLNKALKEAKK